MAIHSGPLKRVIVTFKPKDARPERDIDKLDILRGLLSPHAARFDARLGVDVDRYEAPIVTLDVTAEEAARLRADPNIAAVEDDGDVRALGSLVFEGQPTLAGETIPAGVSQINAPAAWDASAGRGIAVAVLDGGIDFSHPDLAPNYKGGVDIVPGTIASHGTHLAGIIAAARNGAGIVGVAPAASLYSVKVLSQSGAGQWSSLISGIQWCIANKMKIICMAMGGPAAPAALEAICNAAYASGLLLIAAAGSSSGPVGVPARFKNVIAVANIDGSNVIHASSNRGPEIELCAPGVNVLSTANGGGYGTLSGTSMSCAHVAGAAAVVWGAHRFATNTQVWNLLAANAINLDAAGWDPLYGYGRVDVERAAIAMMPAPAMPLRP